ncbi:metal ABC transporter substrate-binding protein [Canibacter zhoujuaniae]|uniref:metal ABC transporter substrate-binding protein n=1 Tax=Canibacter zhoujuaniae TaxID=2708343 RepID=UPI001422D46C|nr:metal ABC transporter substrate-binding protein [Canibacter zhoujuaniae]
MLEGMLKNGLRKRIATLIGAFAVCGLALAGCATGGTSDTGAPQSNGSAEGKLKVVASTTQVQDFVAQIAGDRVQLTGLLKPGASAHNFDPTPADLVALGEADILFLNGVGLEEFLDSAIKSSGFHGKIVEAADAVDLEAAAEITAKSAAQGEADHDGHATEAEDHDHDHDHDHGGVNPHIWTAPKMARQMLDPIAEALSKADPENREYYHENATAYGEKLAALDSWIASEFAKVDPAKKRFVSSHNALLYYLDSYGIEFVGSVIPSFEDNSEPSAAEINELVANIKKSGVQAIFFESSVSDRLSKTVANEANVVLVTDPIYADAVGVEPPANTYIGATIANTENILQAWGYDPSPVPQEVTN